jgi:hypothetical protein
MNRFRFPFILILSIGFMTALRGQETRTPGNQVTVPWEEFRKILRMDENEIVLPIETFRKLVAQTGEKTPPQHTERNGLVVVRRADFQALVDAMRPPEDAEAAPPFDYLVTRAVYSGRMSRNATRFSATFRIHVLKKGAYLRIPVLPQSLALEDMRIDGKPALVVSEEGFHKVVLSAAGEHSAEAVFNVRSDPDRGPQRLDFPIQSVPVTLLRLELPMRNIDVDIPAAQAVSAQPGGAGTVVNAVLEPTGSIGVAWRKKAAAAAKLPSKAYADVAHLVSIEDGAIRTSSDVFLNILHSGMDQVSLSVPADWNVLSVTGEGVGDWQERSQAGGRVVLVPFTYGREGSAAFTVSMEKTLTETGKANVFTGFRVLGVVRETGSVGVALNTSAEVRAAETGGLDRVAVQKLPSALVNKSEKPLLLAYRYLKHPFSLVLDVERHEKISVPQAHAVSANAVTLFTEDGKIVHRIIYQIRNSEKQFLEIRLPENADVWSVLVGGEGVESSLGSDGRLLVPLIRSRSSGERLETFPVEVIYCLSGPPFHLLEARKAASLPAADVMVSQYFWSVYVPNGYAYLYFGSTLEKEEIIRGVNLFGRSQRVLKNEVSGGMSAGVPRPEMNAADAYKGKEAKSRFRNVPMEEEQVQRQFQAEMDFGGKLDELALAPQQAVRAGGSGVMPMQIVVPTTGQVYRFARTIVRPDDPLRVGIWYAKRGLVASVFWILAAFAAWIVFRNRKRLAPAGRWIAGQWRGLRARLARIESSVPSVMRSSGTILLMVLMTIVFAFVSRGLFLLSLFGLWVVLVARIILYFRDHKKKEKSETKRIRKRAPGRGR